MNDLTLKFTGDVSENTLPEYKKEALAFVGKSDFPIVTNDDFSNAVKAVKECKEIEEAITSAKENSFADMEQINKIFEDLGEVYGTVRTFRLKREKDIAKETERKKTKMVADGFAIVSKSFSSASKSNPLILNVISINDSPMRLAIKGKRTEESGKKAIAKSVKTELSRIESAIELTVENEKIITSSGYPDLFQDLKGIIGKPTAEIQLLVDGRVANHKLAEKERKDKVDAAAKAEADRKAREAKEENSAIDIVPQQQKEEAILIAPEGNNGPEKTRTPAQGNVEPFTKSTVTQEPVGDYTVSFKITCTVTQAKAMSRDIRARYGNASLTKG